MSSRDLPNASIGLLELEPQLERDLNDEERALAARVRVPVLTVKKGP